VTVHFCTLFERFGEKYMALKIVSSQVTLANLTQLIKDLGDELHWPASKVSVISADTRLDKDLGLDSLTRVELASRIERIFGVLVGEGLFLDILTVGDLVSAIEKAPVVHIENQRSVKIASQERAVKTNVVMIPYTAQTLNDVLNYYVKNNPNRDHVTVLKSRGEEKNITYADLFEGAKRVASALYKMKINPGDTVAIMLPTCEEYFYCFMGVILAGAIPVALYPPTRASQIVDHLQRHVEILRNAKTCVLITNRSLMAGVGRLLRIGGSFINLVDVDRVIAGDSDDYRQPTAKPTDTAFVQYTSGSTGNPKGVVLTHANILSNIKAMGSVLDVSPNDIFVSWLPLYHDMGLIGAWLGSLVYGCKFIVMSPFSFLSSPIYWLTTIDRFQATLTAAPNFAYELCLKHIGSDDAKRINLRTVKAACNGAEAVDPCTVERFLDFFSASGFSRSAMKPVYGLAESTVGLSFPRLSDTMNIDNIDRKSLESSRLAKPWSGSGGVPLRFVSCGRPLPGHEIRIVDDLDHEVAERVEGRIQFRGPSSTSGYLNKAAENKKLFHGSWLETGDLGYIASGELYITGRIKDVIKHAGRNVHPEELEAAVGLVPGVRKGCVAVFGFVDGNLATERLAVIAETRETDISVRHQIESEINEILADRSGSPPDVIKLVEPHTVLKTSSGKIRRSACKKLFETGQLSSSEHHWRWDMATFVFSGALKILWDIVLSYAVIGRSVVTWALIAIVTLFVWPLTVLLPRLEWRWSAARITARLILFLSRVQLIVYGRMPQFQAIYVANHASYSDVLYLLVAFERPLSFIAKSELKKSFLFNFTLDRLGVIYVERYDVSGAIRDAQVAINAARLGKSLASFPEGTFTRKPGVMPFHVGPFLAAVGLSLPVVPISISGARSVLHPDSSIIRPGRVILTFLETMLPNQNVANSQLDEWHLALKLKDATRMEILKYCGEPDVAFD
jgi:1-acyl-sn-glycerol-3-phosphate acyltransferase